MADVETRCSGGFIDHDKLRELYRFWDRRRGEAPYPVWSAFVAEEFKSWMGHVMIIEPIGSPPRFRVRLHGTRLFDYDGKDLTGWYLDKAVPERSLGNVVGPYLAAVVRGTPQYDTMCSPFEAGTVRRLCRLVLPCSNTGDSVDRLLVGIYLDVHENEQPAHYRPAPSRPPYGR